MKYAIALLIIVGFGSTALAHRGSGRCEPGQTCVAEQQAEQQRCTRRKTTRGWVCIENYGEQ